MFESSFSDSSFTNYKCIVALHVPVEPSGIEFNRKQILKQDLNTSSHQSGHQWLISKVSGTSSEFHPSYFPVTHLFLGRIFLKPSYNLQRCHFQKGSTVFSFPYWESSFHLYLLIEFAVVVLSESKLVVILKKYNLMIQFSSHYYMFLKSVLISPHYHFIASINLYYGISIVSHIGPPDLLFYPPDTSSEM